ncbi:hypothetical protein ACPV5O_06655 [Vibrio maritimus]|uniref:hypothetical protein n=1 Tax=Vibrio maritimus TaxID=990268 RepID=UPI00406829BF
MAKLEAQIIAKVAFGKRTDSAKKPEQYVFKDQVSPPKMYNYNWSLLTLKGNEHDK